MKRFYILLFMLAFSLQISNAWADDPQSIKLDSLTEISVNGTALVNSTLNHPQYFMDVDGDSIADYRLNFGPWWYHPDSSAATRPEDGQLIFISGGINQEQECEPDSLPVIIVYEIDGEFWRDPFEPSWNRKGAFHHIYHNSYHNHKGYAFGWLNDSLETILVEGSVLTDTTFKYTHYYLDTDGDTLPDYFLNFGPPWYAPNSGLQKPAEGETATITGALALKADPPVLFVFELNGETWLDTTGYGTQMGAGWIHRNMNRERRINATFDSLNQMKIRAGWNDGQGPNPLPDELFCQMLQLFPENVPYAQNQKLFAGYEIGVFTRNGKNMMVKKDSVGGSVNFKNALKFRFHYSDLQLQGYNRNENSIQLKRWNQNEREWQVVENAVLDEETNTLSFESMEVPGLVILVAEQATAIQTEENAPQSFTLNQNYPNPFNPQTTIDFSLQKDTYISLTVYNVLGQEIIKLAQGNFKAGLNRVVFSSEQFPSGTYFYELKSATFSVVKKMTLVR